MTNVEKAIELIDAMDENEIEDLTEHIMSGKSENEGKEGNDMTTDEKEIKKAKENIEEKGADSQTEADRIDESVGEQEKKSGDEDTQDAKDRVDESEGTKKADDEKSDESAESNFHSEITRTVNELKEAVLTLVDILKPKSAPNGLDEKREKYGLSARAIATKTAEEYDEKKINSLLGR